MKKLGLNDILETERCFIKVPEESEAEYIWGLVTPGIQQYLIRENIDTIRKSKQETKKGKLWDAAIYRKDNQKCIGRFSVSYICKDTKQVEVGYWIVEDLWGQGYVPECLKRVIHFCFSEGNYEKLIASCNSTNQQSMRVMKKCGMIHEGTFRKDRKVRGKIQDTSFFAIIKEDYTWKK